MIFDPEIKPCQKAESWGSARIHMGTQRNTTEETPRLRNQLHVQGLQIYNSVKQGDRLWVVEQAAFSEQGQGHKD